MSTTPHSQSVLLQEAIAAALAGDKEAARKLLAQVTAAYPGNELAWLWLASVSTTTQEVMRCWRQVISLNPQQEQAVLGLKRLLLQEGVAAAKNGSKGEARALLVELTELDRHHEVAWLWLATLAKDVEEATRHTLQVLHINPNNERAKAWIDKLQPQAAADRAVTAAAAAGSPPVGEHLVEPSGAYTILMVDDSPTIRKLVSLTLAKYGHQVICADNGLDALNKLKEVLPDLILSDITMPHLDGYQLCKIIRSNSITKSVPIIMLSGKDGIFDKLRGRMVGATAYITKPFEIDSLLQLIDMHCQQAAQRI